MAEVRGQKLEVRSQKKIYFFLSSVFCLLFSALPSALACPLCKEAIAKMGEIWTSLGFNLSIYLMLSTHCGVGRFPIFQFSQAS